MNTYPPPPYQVNFICSLLCFLILHYNLQIHVIVGVLAVRHVCDMLVTKLSFSNVSSFSDLTRLATDAWYE